MLDFGEFNFPHLHLLHGVRGDSRTPKSPAVSEAFLHLPDLYYFSIVYTESATCPLRARGLAGAF